MPRRVCKQRARIFRRTAAVRMAVLLLLLLSLALVNGCATYTTKFGLVLHFAERFGESNEAFAAAERTADALYTKSLSEGAFSLFTNDNAISYRARPFEMAMVPYYKGLNYIYLGQREEAQVEARRASLLMAKYVDATLDGLRDADRSDLEKIRNNAFLLYFSGMLYDWDGELNDAFIAYRNAAVAYQQTAATLDTEIPPSLGRDLTRVAVRRGFRAELNEVRQSCPDVFVAEDGNGLPVSREDYEKMSRWKRGQGEVVEADAGSRWWGVSWWASGNRVG